MKKSSRGRLGVYSDFQRHSATIFSNESVIFEEVPAVAENLIKSNLTLIQRPYNTLTKVLGMEGRIFVWFAPGSVGIP
jgi:hypothetical protein